MTDGVQPEGHEPLSSLRASSAVHIKAEQIQPLRGIPAFPSYIRRRQPWLACHAPRPTLKRLQGKFQSGGTAATSPFIHERANRPFALCARAHTVEPVEDDERFPLASHAVVLSTASLTHP